MDLAEDEERGLTVAVKCNGTVTSGGKSAPGALPRSGAADEKGPPYLMAKIPGSAGNYDNGLFNGSISVSLQTTGEVIEKKTTTAKKSTTKETPPKPAATKSTAKTHTLASGETLYRLSTKYGVSVAAIQKANNIKNPNAMREGMKLVIPAK